MVSLENGESHSLTHMVSLENGESDNITRWAVTQWQRA